MASHLEGQAVSEKDSKVGEKRKKLSGKKGLSERKRALPRVYEILEVCPWVSLRHSWIILPILGRGHHCVRLFKSSCRETKSTKEKRLGLTLGRTMFINSKQDFRWEDFHHLWV